MFCLCRSFDATGRGFKDLVCDIFEKSRIDIIKCIGRSTDGAANMSGEYNGFRAWLQQEVPWSVYIWCYAHLLNLVLVETTNSKLACSSLFSLLNGIAAFIRDFYKRMDVWTLLIFDSDKRRLNLIGEARWWAKDVALTKVFGTLEAKEKSLFTTLVATLEVIVKDMRD